MSQWWNSYGDFEPDQSGQYPLPGQVLAHYRERAGLSREQVSASLGVGAKAVYYAEHEGRGLDSIARMRQVGALLHIPLALLGLCSAPAGENWWAVDYGQFLVGKDGWPDVGSVLHFYRRRRSWTQYDLADALGISNLGVINMERKHAGLDSITRRRALRFVLGIPALLLGLDGVHGAPALVHAASVASTLPTLSDLQLAQSRLWNSYYTGDVEQLQKVSSLLTLKDALTSMSTAQRAAYLEQASLLAQAAGNLALQSARQPVILSHMDAGIDYARLSDDSSLLSTALGRRAAALYELGDLPGAHKSIREALSVASPSEQAKRYPVATRVLSCLAQDLSDRQEVFQMLDKIVVNDRYQNGVDSNIILWCRGQVLLNLADNAPDRSKLLRQASELLDRAELGAPDTLRRKLIIKLAQARAYLGLRELEYSVDSAIEAFGLMKQVKSVLYLSHLSDIYHSLMHTSYAGSPQVARLGLLLFQVGA